MYVPESCIGLFAPFSSSLDHFPGTDAEWTSFEIILDSHPIHQCGNKVRPFQQILQPQEVPAARRMHSLISFHLLFSALDWSMLFCLKKLEAS